MRVKPNGWGTYEGKVKLSANKNRDFKPHIIPEGMVVKIDTREQSPLWLPKPPKDLCVMRGTLKNGDYSIVGFEDTFAIERKMGDIFTYITSDRENTNEKIKRMLGYEFKALVIEMDEDELYAPQMYTEIPMEVIRQTINSFEVKSGLHVYYGNREKLERKVLDWMIYYWNYKHEI